MYFKCSINYVYCKLSFNMSGNLEIYCAYIADSVNNVVVDYFW